MLSLPSPSSTNSTLSSFTSSSSSLPGSPPDIFVPDDFKDDSAAPPRHSRRSPSGVFSMFSRIDSLMSPARLKHEAAVVKWHKGVKAKMTQAQASPTLSTLHDILDEPLLEHDVGKHKPRLSPATKMGKKSPAARLASAIAAAMRSEQRSKQSYLVKPAPTLPSGRAAAIKAKTPPKWRRSPKLLKQLLGERERGAELAHTNSRWIAAVGQPLAPKRESPGGKRTISWAAVGGAAALRADALDEFMQRPASEARAIAPAVAPPRSDLQALCRAKRREVLLEMGVSAEDLHPTLRGYAPRPEVVPAAASGDALDAFMS